MSRGPVDNPRRPRQTRFAAMNTAIKTPPRNPAILALLTALAVVAGAQAAQNRPALAFESLPAARFEFSGPIGERVRANIESWHLCAPQANPGMIEMFHQRDRLPAPQLVPWAGEFAGKYLISAVQALRMSEDPRLRPQVAGLVAKLIDAQAPDGYLGPFPKKDRLLKNWDLWGHYHIILGLALWHEQTGDAPALAAARKAADLVCATYLDTGRRVFDAGDPEMNMAILTGMVLIHRLTGEPRYLRMAREVEKDWERAGDYLRAGLDGREFYRSPRPRWESLHDLQGLLELWRVTGENKYRDAFEHHWRSIRRWDRRNTGGFSSGEQATGNPCAPTAIETCCTVAWMALTVDYLRLTGDLRAADELELATLNGGLGAQHPSGRWWTYSTPMDGVREASAHAIVFQARAGTPELNCCSVNGPRIPGMLSEWALMGAPDGLVLNWLGAGRFSAKLASGTAVTLGSSGDAWQSGRTDLSVSSAAPETFTLRVRIASWARDVRARLNGTTLPSPAPGAYLTLQRRWTAADRLELSFDMPLRFAAGASETAGKVSLYRGPVLLAFDSSRAAPDESGLPEVDLARLQSSILAAPSNTPGLVPPPWLSVDVPAAGSRSIRLVDFASAGAAGTPYRSWFAARPTQPPPSITQLPPDAARVPAGPVVFQWRSPRARGVSSRVEFSTNESFAAGTVWSTNTPGNRLLLDTRALASKDFTPIWWRIVSTDGTNETVADVPPAWFQIDPAAPPQSLPPEPKRGPDGELILHSLQGDTPPEFGALKSATAAARNADGAELNGRGQMLVYSVPAWPEEDFTVSVRVRITELPTNRIGQIFSAWASSMDDPLRLVVEKGKVFARIEAGGVFSTPGAAVQTGRWHAIAAVKQGGKLTLYLDGRAAGSCAAPEFSATQAQDCALGGNPHYGGDESLAARFRDFRFLARALSPQEIEGNATESAGK